MKTLLYILIMFSSVFAELYPSRCPLKTVEDMESYITILQVVLALVAVCGCILYGVSL